MAFNIIKLLFIAVLIAIFSYMLWLKGYLVISAKRAVMFMGHRGKGLWGASFTSCTGYTKRSVRLESGAEYLFTLDYIIDNGSAMVEISHAGQPVATLDQANTTASLTAVDGLYVITTRFKSASGIYELKWDKK